MRRAWQRLAIALTVLGLAFTAATARAEIAATLEPRIVDEFDTVRLTIRVGGTRQSSGLELAPLEEDFEVLTTQTSSQYRSINGRVEAWVEYQILLRPRRSGDLTVPPIEIAGEHTEPLSLRVRGVPPELREAIDRMVFFETELTTNPVYVQAQTVLIRRLYYASGAQIYSDLPGIPQIDEAIVMPLGETTSTATIRDGRRYSVIEQRFAVLPERSGELTIPAISITSSVRLQSDGRMRRSGVRVTTEPITLEVLPIPPEYPAGAPWLPASDLVITESWAPEERRVDVGQPLQRTLRAMVVGNVSSAIPPLSPVLPDGHFRRYPEPPDLRDDTRSNDVRGIREQTYAIIPTAPGTVPLPPTEVVWWDVDDRTVRTASAPGRNFSIVGAPVDMSPDAQPEQAARRQAPNDDAAQTGEPSPVELAPGRNRPQTLWAMALAILAIVALGYALRDWLGGVRRRQTDTLRNKRTRLARACREGTPAAVHRSLLEYLCSYYDEPLPEALRRFRAAGHGALLDELNAARYAPEHRSGVDTGALWQAVRGLRRRRGRDSSAAASLPALYD